MKSKFTNFIFITTAFVLGVLASRWFRSQSEAQPPVQKFAQPIQESGSPTDPVKQERNSVDSTGGPEFDISQLDSELTDAVKEFSPGKKDRRLYRLGESIPVRDIPAALRILNKRREPEAVKIGYVLLSRWAVADPRAAISYVEALPRSKTRETSFRIVLAEWAAAAPASALDWVSHLASPAERTQCVSTILNTVAGQDPSRAILLMQSLKNSVASAQLTSVIFRRWAQTDPAAAAVALSNLKGSPPSLFPDIAAAWAAQEPERALAWAQSLGSPQVRGEATQRVIAEWASVDPKSAATFAMGQPTGRVRDQMLIEIARRWAVVDSSAAIQWANALSPGATRTDALQNALEQDAQRDPQGAGSQALTLLPPDKANSLISRISTDWFATDPAGAISWVKGLPAANQAAAGRPIISLLLEADPAKAAEFVGSISDGFIRNGFMGDLASKWAAQDLSGAVTWLKTLPEGQDKAVAFQKMQAVWADTDPKGAATYVQALPAGQALAAVGTVVSVWAQNDPAAAANWVGTLQGDVASSAFYALIGSWVKRSPIDVANYVADLSPGPLQNWAINRVVKDWSLSDPVPVADWVSKFPPDLRTTAISSVVENWAYRDPRAVAAWLDSMGTDDQVPKQNLASIWMSIDSTTARTWIQTSTLPQEVKLRFLTSGSN